MSKDIRTVIAGYTVEYTPSNDNGLTDCHIWKVGETGRIYSASLQVLVDTGCLYRDNLEMSVSLATIDKIETWANEQGWSE